MGRGQFGSGELSVAGNFADGRLEYEGTIG